VYNILVDADMVDFKVEEEEEEAEVEEDEEDEENISDKI
jgi:hypothetical protein